MNLLSKFQNWIKSDKVKELEQKLEKIEKPQVVCEEENNSFKIRQTIYNFSSGNCDIILQDGEILNANISQEVYEQLRNCKSRQCIISLISPKQETEESTHQKEEQEIKQQLGNLVDILKEIDDFDVVSNEQVYLKNVKTIQLPWILIAEFVRLVSELSRLRDMNDHDNTYGHEIKKLEKEYHSTLMFAHRLLLNPIEKSREDCLKFVKKFNIKLTTTGLMVMFRRIDKVAKNTELVEFVSKWYFKIKSWKKSVGNYEVYRDENGVLKCSAKGEIYQDRYEGNLKTLYENLSELKENRYTDNYTGKYDIRLGGVYRINESDIENNKNGSCGGALHVADGQVFDYSGFGCTPVSVLVSPTYIYKMDTGCSGKIGCKEMFIMAVTELDENGDYVDLKTQDVVEFEEIYNNQNLFELQEELKNRSFKSLCIKEEMPEITFKDIENIATILQNRIISI